VGLSKHWGQPHSQQIEPASGLDKAYLFEPEIGILWDQVSDAQRVILWILSYEIFVSSDVPIFVIQHFNCQSGTFDRPLSTFDEKTTQHQRT
jgi:hypothetical protein